MSEYISRKAAIAYIREQSEECQKAFEELGGESGIYADAYNDLAEDFYSIPAADVAPVVHWVLTDEKLPPDGQDVLCWYEYFRFGEYNRMYQTFGIGYQFNGNWGGEVVQGQKAKVLAWIPLPKPPKMEGGESGETD